MRYRVRSSLALGASKYRQSMKSQCGKAHAKINAQKMRHPPIEIGDNHLGFFLIFS
jgi:hypothetical protein